MSRPPLRRSLWLASALALCAAGQGGCATCRRDRPPVEPRAGGSVGVESGGGWWSDVGVALDVSNLFCKPPPPETEHQPGPGSEPLPDAPEPETPPGSPPPAPAGP